MKGQDDAVNVWICGEHSGTMELDPQPARPWSIQFTGGQTEPRLRSGDVFLISM